MHKWSLLVFFSITLVSCGKANSASSVAISSPAQATPSAGNSDGDPVVLAALGRANEIRRQNGLPELVVDSKLSAVAQAHAEDMLKRQYFDHSTPEGVTPFQRMQDAGVEFQAAAENIAMGTSSAQQVFTMWLGSAGHRKNLLNKVYGRHGIGYAGGYWVHDFTN